jgi:hypothetical protein
MQLRGLAETMAYVRLKRSAVIVIMPITMNHILCSRFLLMSFLLLRVTAGTKKKPPNDHDTINLGGNR